MKKRVLGMILGTMLLVTSIAGCGNNEGGGADEQKSESKQENEAGSSDGVKEVQFWHCMSGTNGELVEQLVKDFNESQDEIKVVATFQGTYAEAAAKAEQAIFAGNAPDILQVAQDNVGRLAVSGAFEDLLPYMEKDSVDPNDFVEAFVKDAYYDDKLVAIPFGRSSQILHINKTVLDEMGCKIPTTWEELKDVANKCTVVENGETKRYGLSVPFDQWEFLH